MKLRRRTESPHWLVDLVDPRGHRVRRTTGETDKRMATVKARAMQRALEDAAADDKDGRTAVALSVALHDYAGRLHAERKASACEAEGIAKKTMGMAPHTGRFAIPGDRLIHTITEADLERLKVSRALEGNSTQTIAHELKTLRAACRYSHRLGHRTPDIRSWGIPTVAAKTRWLTVDEVAAVRAALSPDGYVGQAQRQRAEAQAVLILLTQTGMRWGELCALRVADVRDGEVHVWASKTERARVVPLTAVAATHLALLTTAGHSLVLGGRRGCASLSRAIDRVCNTTDAVSRMGRATIHSLRHTYASRLRQGGAGLDEVQDMLGHANIAMTRRYAHLGKRETQDRMRNILEQST